MSFGFSVGDFITVIVLANKIRKMLVDVPSNFLRPTDNTDSSSSQIFRKTTANSRFEIRERKPLGLKDELSRYARRGTLARWRLYFQAFAPFRGNQLCKITLTYAHPQVLETLLKAIEMFQGSNGKGHLQHGRSQVQAAPR